MTPLASSGHPWCRRGYAWLPKSEIAATNICDSGGSLGEELGEDLGEIFWAFSCFICCVEWPTNLLPKLLPIYHSMSCGWNAKISSPRASGVLGAATVGVQKKCCWKGFGLIYRFPLEMGFPASLSYLVRFESSILNRRPGDSESCDFNRAIPSSQYVLRPLKKTGCNSDWRVWIVFLQFYFTTAIWLTFVLFAAEIRASWIVQFATRNSVSLLMKVWYVCVYIYIEMCRRVPLVAFLKVRNCTTVFSKISFIQQPKAKWMLESVPPESFLFCATSGVIFDPRNSYSF